MGLGYDLGAADHNNNDAAIAFYWIPTWGQVFYMTISVPLSSCMLDIYNPFCIDQKSDWDK
jgi:hypothetical protein